VKAIVQWNNRPVGTRLRSPVFGNAESLAQLRPSDSELLQRKIAQADGYRVRAYRWRDGQRFEASRVLPTHFQFANFALPSGFTLWSVSGINPVVCYPTSAFTGIN